MSDGAEQTRAAMRRLIGTEGGNKALAAAMASLLEPVKSAEKSLKRLARATQNYRGDGFDDARKASAAAKRARKRMRNLDLVSRGAFQ